MNREEFVLTLRKELSKLPPEEIVAATEYFEEIFTEATEGLGEEERLAEEKRLVEEFGNPKKIAAQIKADYAARLLNGDETVLDKKPGAKKKLSAVWWVIIGICTAPVSIPIIGCLFCIAIGIACGIIGIYAGIIGGGVAAIAALILGCVFLTSSVSSGLMAIGIGLIGIAIVAAAAVGAFIGTRELIRAIARTAKDQNHKRKNKKYFNMKQGGEDESAWVRTDDGEQEYYEMLEAPESEMLAEEEMAFEGGEER